MREKTRKIFIMIVMAALIVSLTAASFAALTYGRYTGGKLDDDSPYDEIIDFVGETAFEVSTADELVNAINNGYSYIKVVGDDPTLVVNNNVADVVVNLVLDVNGHKIVRNSRNPLFNVRQSVSVVLVYDSSTDADGGFYNPVGSALQTSGGTLTVGAGVYESGPRTDTSSSAPDTVSATVCSRTERTAASYSAPSPNQTFPKLTEDTGDVYLDENYSGTGDYLKADTYLIYTEEKNAFIGDGKDGLQKDQLYVNAKETSSGETTTITADKFSPICDVASCDFYYYYPVDVAGTAKSPQTYAVVYGYNDVKALAEDCTDTSTDTSTDLSKKGLVWPYAAIRSEAGNTHARGGEFYTYFGEENTYSIYSEGGTMTVGLSGESDPPKFQAIGKGVCINMAGTSGNADQTLTIENGEFSSKIGDTIKMSGGEMTVTRGSFTKNASSADPNSTDNGSAIDITGGTLNMTGTEANDVKSVSFDIKGNYVNGIKMEKEESATADPDTIKNAAFSFNKESGQGSGGTSVAAIQVLNGSLNVSDSTFDFNQGYAGTAYTNNGIYVQGGSVNATNCAFSLSPNGSVTGSAAIASAGGKVTAEGCDFEVNGYSNYGVYSLGGEITATDCGFTMTQAGSLSDGRGDNFGIYSTLSENISAGTATANGCTINVTGTYSAGVLSMAGTLNLGASTTKATSITVSFEGNELSSSGVSSEGGEINLTGNTEITSDGLGITARGEVNVTGGTSTVTTARGTGVYVQNGTLNIEQSATVSVESKIDNNCTWVVPPEHQDEDEPLQTNKFNGVFVNGGSLISNGTLNVTFTGVQNDKRNARGDDQIAYNGENTSFLNQQTKSYAVRVEAAVSGGKTEVSIAGGTISNSVGGGVLVNGGTVTLGKQETTNGVTTYSGPTVQTTGTEVDTSRISINGMADNWAYYWNMTGGDAVKVDGGELAVYGGTYTAAQGNGILTRGGTATIYNGTFTGGYNSDSHATTGAASTYSFKAYGGTVNISGGNFDSDAEGAFVMGTSASDKVTITGGSFQAKGPTAFATWNGATVEFDDTNSENKIFVSGESTGLTVEQVSSEWSSQNITIKSATFESTNQNESNKNGIWYGNGNAKLTISGGSFKGSTGSGLFFGATPNTIDGDDTIMIVQISGGRFEGNPVRDGGSSNYKSGAIAGKIGSYWDPGYSVGVNYILKIGARISSSGWGNDETVQDGDGSSKWNDAIQETLASCSWIEIS